MGCDSNPGNSGGAGAVSNQNVGPSRLFRSVSYSTHLLFSTAASGWWRPHVTDDTITKCLRLETIAGLDPGVVATAQRIGFMLTFPVIVWRSTLVNFRRWVTTPSPHGLGYATFNEYTTWLSLTKKIYTQFSIVMAWAWVFERDEYFWSIESLSKTDTVPGAQAAIIHGSAWQTSLHWKMPKKGKISGADVFVRDTVCWLMPSAEQCIRSDGHTPKVVYFPYNHNNGISQSYVDHVGDLLKQTRLRECFKKICRTDAPLRNSSRPVARLDFDTAVMRLEQEGSEGEMRTGSAEVNVSDTRR
jgi:hypothetical protein